MGDVRSSTSGTHLVTAGDAELVPAGVACALWRAKWWVAGSTLTIAVLTFAVVNLLPPSFKSEARVLIEGQENVFLRPEAEKVERAPELANREAVTSQVELALSRDLAREVTGNLKLGDCPEFDPTRRGSAWLGSLMRLVGIVKGPLSVTPSERVLETYYDHLRVYQVDRSRIIAVEFRSDDRDLAARVANAVADAYVQLLGAVKREQARAAGQRLAGDIEDLRQKVANAEGRVEAFKARRFIALNNTLPSKQLLTDLNSQLAAARSRKADAEAKAQFVRDALRSGNPVDSPDFVHSELLRRLSGQRAMLRLQLAEQSATVPDGRTRIKELKAQISDIEHEMYREVERLAHALENDARIAASRVQTLTDDLEQLERQAASANEQDVELRALEREARADRDLLETYLAKSRETATGDNLATPPAEARVISRATASNTPYLPRKVSIVFIAAVTTFVAATGLITTRVLLVGRRYRPIAAETVSKIDAPIGQDLGGPPEPSTPSERRGTADLGPVGPLPDPVRSLIDIVDALAGTGRRGCRVIVVGAARHVGTTHCAVELARLLAANGRVVLVDLALGAPGLAAWAVDPGALGITQLVRGAASIGQAITRDRGSEVHIVPAGQINSDGGDAVLRSDRLRMALDALAVAYDYLVMDVGDAADVTLKRVVNRASVGVLVMTAESKSAAGPLHLRLTGAGLADVMIVRGRELWPTTAPSDTHVAAA